MVVRCYFFLVVKVLLWSFGSFVAKVLCFFASVHYRELVVTVRERNEGCQTTYISAS